MNILDLHGYNLKDAHEETLDFLRDMYGDKETKVKIITGKGAISKEFPFWIEKSTYIKKYEPTSDGGCWYITMADYHRPVM